MSSREYHPCTFHPKYAATGRCIKCKRLFCKVCLERVKDATGEVCIECLTHEDLARRSSVRRMLTLYIAGFVASIAIVMNGLQSQYPPILQMLLAPDLSFMIFLQWYTQGRTPIEMVYFALAAMGGFAVFAAMEFRNARNLRRKLLEHGFCPNCGRVLFGNTKCPKCERELPDKPPEYPDVEWLRNYLKMEKRKAVSPELLKEKEKRLRSKYRRRKPRKI
ncbi:MAG: hypothetical protein QXW47_02490 [Candidatus Jordarchaeales archaeon]